MRKPLIYDRRSALVFLGFAWGFGLMCLWVWSCT